MCAECGCKGNSIGKVNEKLTGKPTGTPTGLYNGVGGSPVKQGGKK